MSVRAINWAFEQEVPPPQKVVLLALADWADGDGVAYPGQKSLAAKTSIPERTLRRVIEELEQAGLIERRRRHLGNGNRTSDEYRLISVAPAAKLAGSQAAKSGGDNRPTVAGTGEPSVEPSVTTYKTRGRATPLPVGWEPSNAHRLLAASLKVDVDFESEKFKDWTAANAVTKADWEATFRNWLRTASERARQRPDSRPSRDEEIRQVMQGSLGLDEQRAVGQ